MPSLDPGEGSEAPSLDPGEGSEAHLNLMRKEDAMRKIVVVSLLLVLLFASSLFAESLVVIGWDGAGSNNVIPLLEQGKLPGLRSILDTGGVFVDIETISKTVTVPTHVVLFTGLTSDQTGVSTNRDTRTRVPIGDIITKKIRDRGDKVGWYVSKDFLWSNSPLKAITTNIDGGGLYNAHTSSGCTDGYITNLSSGAIQFIIDNRGTDFLLFIHTNPDCYGHRDGENSERYLHEFIRSDELLQNVLSVIDANTKVAVLNDHGFDEGMQEHNSAPDLWMVTNIPLKSVYSAGKRRGREGYCFFNFFFFFV